MHLEVQDVLGMNGVLLGDGSDLSETDEPSCLDVSKH